MNETEFLLKTMKEYLDNESPVVLISILNSAGSTPRHEGTRMAVGLYGKPCGTIGGGLIKVAAIEKAREILVTRRPEVFSYSLAGEQAGDSGMACGGNADILLDYLAPAAENREFIGNWYQAIVDGIDFFVCVSLVRKDTEIGISARSIVLPGGESLGPSLPITAGALNLRNELRKIKTATILPVDGMDILIDPVRRTKTLYCFGAGHVAVPTAHIAAMAGFRVVVVDDRPEYANSERFPEAWKVVVINDFNRALDNLPVDEDSFIVIITRDHQYDRIVLEQALRTEAGYIGMISSRQKRKAVYAALRETGITPEMLDKVHSPIGFDIGGETPGEIAVSIVAELISVRNGKLP